MEFNKKAAQTSIGCHTPVIDEHHHGLSEHKARHTPQQVVTKYRDHMYDIAKQKHECTKYCHPKEAWQDQYAKVPDDCATREEILELIEALPVAEAEIFRRYMETQVIITLCNIVFYIVSSLSVI